jgi:hypothetical protein
MFNMANYYGSFGAIFPDWATPIRPNIDLSGHENDLRRRYASTCPPGPAEADGLHLRCQESPQLSPQSLGLSLFNGRRADQAASDPRSRCWRLSIARPSSRQRPRLLTPNFRRASIALAKRAHSLFNSGQSLASIKLTSIPGKRLARKLARAPASIFRRTSSSVTSSCSPVSGR